MPDLLAMREDLLDGGSRRVCEYSPSAGGHIDTARDRRGDDVSLLSVLQNRMAGVSKRILTKSRGRCKARKRYCAKGHGGEAEAVWKATEPGARIAEGITSDHRRPTVSSVGFSSQEWDQPGC